MIGYWRAVCMEVCMYRGRGVSVAVVLHSERNAKWLVVTRARWLARSRFSKQASKVRERE